MNKVEILNQNDEFKRPFWRKIPGFRSLTLWKMICASIVYLLGLAYLVLIIMYSTFPKLTDFLGLLGFYGFIVTAVGAIILAIKRNSLWKICLAGMLVSIVFYMIAINNL